MDIGAVFLILAVILLISIFISRPFFERVPTRVQPVALESDATDHKRSSLLAEYDRTLSAIQELEFDHTLGKIPAEEFPQQRTNLLETASNLLHQLDEFQEKSPHVAVEDRIEAAISARRMAATAASKPVIPAASSASETSAVPVQATAVDNAPAVEMGTAVAKEDEVLETLIAIRRGSRQTKAGGFCPRCGRPVQKNDRFCPKCGAPC